MAGVMPPSAIFGRSWLYVHSQRVGTPTAAMDGSITPAATSTAVGTAAVANHITGTAIGGSAYAHGPNDTAIGSNARVNADGSTAVGANTQIAAVATNAVAMGEGAQVTAASGTAIGQGARATAQGAVALGQGAVADRANTVSVGSVGGERQVANVAAGTRATDAVNKGQLDSGVAAANSYTDSRYNAMADSFESYQGDIEDRLRRQNRRLDRQGAMSSAMLNMSASVAGIASQNRIGAGVGFQNGESALSVGYQRAISPRATVTVGGAHGDDLAVGKAGLLHGTSSGKGTRKFHFWRLLMGGGITERSDRRRWRQLAEPFVLRGPGVRQLPAECLRPGQRVRALSPVAAVLGAAQRGQLARQALLRAVQRRLWRMGRIA